MSLQRQHLKSGSLISGSDLQSVTMLNVLQSRLLLGNSIPDGTSLLNFTALPGTVCLFGAKYLPDDFSFRTKRIPPESCGVPAVQPTGMGQAIQRFQLDYYSPCEGYPQDCPYVNATLY